MANSEHVDILRKGVSEWNKWRRSQVEQGAIDGLSSLIPPFLRADLAGADFSGSQLSTAELFHTDLTSTSFAKAVLTSATFGPLHLGIREELWKGAMYTSVAAILIGTDLSGAMLQGATFEACPLVDVDFSHAFLGNTRFLNVSLARAKGLESCNHVGPSYLDHRTLLQSGILPSSFLRGCGLPDTLIDYLPSLLKESLQFYSCFISYSTANQEFAKRLHADLQREGVRCWFAPEDLKIGEKLRSSFDEAIRIHDKLMVLLSENSVNSAWVEKEVETAFEKEGQQKRIVLFPIRLDDAVMETKQAWAADIRRTRHIGDFRDWRNANSYKKAFDRLLRDLRAGDKAEAVGQV